MGRLHLSLDDFEWVQRGFDDWAYVLRGTMLSVATINHFNGWHVRVYKDPSNGTPLHVDSLDAAKALAQITAAQHLEEYTNVARTRNIRPTTKADGPPPFRRGVFKVG